MKNSISAKNPTITEVTLDDEVHTSGNADTQLTDLVLRVRNFMENRGIAFLSVKLTDEEIN